MQNFIVRITEEDFSQAAGIDAGCQILPATAESQKAAAFIAKTRAQGRLTLIEGENAPQVCHLLNADGVVIAVDSTQPYKKQIAAVQQQLGSGKILGIICPVERHAAMIVSECEPDFLIFDSATVSPDKFQELTDWYAELFLIQSAVAVDSPDAPLENLKYDFVVCSDRIYKILIAKHQRLD